jgi:hypothetical protein
VSRSRQGGVEAPRAELLAAIERGLAARRPRAIEDDGARVRVSTVAITAAAPRLRVALARVAEGRAAERDEVVEDEPAERKARRAG